MVRVEPTRERIGDMLVAAELITPAQLNEALAKQRETSLPIGKQLVALGYVSELQLTQLLSHQLSVPWVSLERIEFSESLLSRVPAELCDRYTVMPVYERSVRHQGTTLYVAMDDPTNEEALRRIAIASGLPVKPMIAAPSDIRRAIDEHYFGGVSDDAQELSEKALEQPEPQAGKVTVDLKGGRPRPPPPPAKGTASSKNEGVVPTELYETPSTPPNQAPRTVTLLDGTTVSLPSKHRRFAQEATQVRHVVKAVRAANADLGLEAAPRWHDIVQTLLDALEARGVRLTRKEIQDAWIRARQNVQDPSK